MSTIKQTVTTPTTEVARVLTPQEKHRFVENRFYKMAQYITDFDKLDISNRQKQPLKEILFTNYITPANQRLTQEQMRAAFESIRKNVQLGKSGNIEIDFSDFTQKHIRDKFYLNDTIFGLRGSVDGLLFHDFGEFERYNIQVVIGEYEGNTRAFVEADGFAKETDDDFEETRCIFEATEISMLSTFASEDRNLDIMTVFNKELGVMHFEVFGGTVRKNITPRDDIPSDAKTPEQRGDNIVFDDDGNA